MNIKVLGKQECTVTDRKMYCLKESFRRTSEITKELNMTEDLELTVKN